MKQLSVRLIAADTINDLFDDPVRRLLIAVLERALLDLADHTVIGYEYHADGTPIKQRDLVFKWILNDDDTSDCSFTFIQICGEIGLDPQAARKQILNSHFVIRRSKHGKAIRGSYSFPRHAQRPRPGRMCRKDRARASSTNRQ